MDPVEYSAKVLKQEKRFLRYLKRIEQSRDQTPVYQGNLSGFMENQRKVSYLVFSERKESSFGEKRGEKITFVKEPAPFFRPIFWPDLRVAHPSMYRFYTNNLFHTNELTIGPSKT